MALASSLALALFALGAPAAEAERPEATPDAREDTVRLGRVYLRVQSVDLGTLRDGIALRVPHIELRTFEGSVPTPEDARLAALVDVEPSGEDERELSLTIIVSDGRAFDRRLDVGADEDRARVVAGAVANLLLGIEAGTAVADRGDVPMPEAPVSPEAATCPKVPAATCPDIGGASSPPSPPPSTNLGLRAGVPITIGLGAPTDADRYTALGADLAGMLRFRRGALVGVSVRIGGRDLGDVGLVRARFGLGGGYVLRRGAFELEASGWLTVEPWWVRRGAAAASFAAGGEAMLLGGAARLGPGLSWRPSSGSPLFRFGAFAELAVSGMPTRGLDLARITVAGPRQPTVPARVGGLEASLGFELTAWWSLDRPR